MTQEEIDEFLETYRPLLEDLASSEEADKLGSREREIGYELISNKDALIDACTVGTNPHYDKLPPQLIQIYEANYRTRALEIISKELGLNPEEAAGLDGLINSLRLNELLEPRRGTD